MGVNTISNVGQGYIWYVSNGHKQIKLIKIFRDL